MNKVFEIIAVAISILFMVSPILFIVIGGLL